MENFCDDVEENESAENVVIGRKEAFGKVFSLLIWLVAFVEKKQTRKSKSQIKLNYPVSIITERCVNFDFKILF
jgi:hypothetical protein